MLTNRTSRLPGAARPGVRRRIVAGLVAASACLGVVGLASPAQAYTKTGCKWSTGTLNIDYRLVNGNFRTALNQATNGYNAYTDVNLTTVDSSGPSFTAQNTNYGATGWEGQASWSCPFGPTNNAQIRVNQYYLSGLEPVTRLKVVWMHEVGHALGLSHVSTVARVMYTSASAAYNAGVITLTSDEIAGINYLY